jgi:hypothetical protein
MTEQEYQYFIGQVRLLTENNRARCLWFAQKDFVPKTIEEARRILSYIEKYGDRVAFEESGRLKQWLSHHSSGISAG